MLIIFLPDVFIKEVTITRNVHKKVKFSSCQFMVCSWAMNSTINWIGRFVCKLNMLVVHGLSTAVENDHSWGVTQPRNMVGAWSGLSASPALESLTNCPQTCTAQLPAYGKGQGEIGHPITGTTGADEGLFSPENTEIRTRRRRMEHGQNVGHRNCSQQGRQGRRYSSPLPWLLTTSPAVSYGRGRG